MYVVPTTRGQSSVPAGSARKAKLTLENLESRAVPAGLGAAAAYNVFVFDDFTVTEGGQTHGRVAAGGDVFVQNYSVGSSTWDTPGLTEVLTAGGSIYYGSGQILNGNIKGGVTPFVGAVNYPSSNILTGDSSTLFNDAIADLSNKSSVWAGYSANGTAQNQWGGLYLNGTDSNLNVFSVNASQLNGIWGMNINVPWGSQVVVNVVGQNVDMRYMGMSASTQSSKVLFNFVDAEFVGMEGMGFQGNLLAPEAQVVFRNGSFQGTLVAESFGGNATFIRNNSELTIDAPPVLSGVIGGTVIFEGEEISSFSEEGPSNSVENLTVLLSGTDINNNPVNASATTDAAGNYQFDDLPPGTYEVSLDVDPEVYLVDSSAGSLGGIPLFGVIIDIILPAAGISLDNAFYLSIQDLIDLDPIEDPDPIFS